MLLQSRELTTRVAQRELGLHPATTADAYRRSAYLTVSFLLLALWALWAQLAFALWFHLCWP
jgi:hypothetical protein